MSKRLNIVGELMNNSYARARNAFTDRNVNDYQRLARIQSDLGVSFLTLNIDGTLERAVVVPDLRRLFSEKH